MRLLVVAATGFEILPLTEHLQKKYVSTSEVSYQHGALEVWILITGVGQALTTYALTKALGSRSFNLVIHAGIAGAFDVDRFPLGSVVQVSSDTFADLGVEDKSGQFTSAFELNLVNPEQPPFSAGRLWAPAESQLPGIAQVRGITVNRVHGQAQHIHEAIQLFQPDIETMEGAACFLVCLQEQVPFLELRSISNKVEPRNREAWNIPLAIETLNTTLIALLEQFE